MDENNKEPGEKTTKGNSKENRNGPPIKKEGKEATSGPKGRTGIIAIVVVVIIILASTLAFFVFRGDDGDNGGDKPDDEKEPPVADAGGNREVKSLEPIIFSGSDSYDPDGGELAYNWSFGDGSFSSDAGPSHVYTRPGLFLVTLTVEDDEGDVVIDSAYIRILNRLPAINIDVPVELHVFQVVRFNGTATDPDGFISLYEWDFDGDGRFDWYAKTTGLTTNYYTVVGNYTARFKVTDDNGGTNTIEINITVDPIPNDPPSANAGSDQKAGAGLITLFGTGTDPDDNIITYEWDFNGDGSYDWTSNAGGLAVHEFTNEGVYGAVFRVTDEFGLSDTDEVNITIDNSLVSASIGTEITIAWISNGVEKPISYGYNLAFNTTLEPGNLSVVISKLPSGELDEIGASDLTVEPDNRNASFSSTLAPTASDRLKIEVFYLEYLVGVRELDLTGDHPRRLLNPYYDQDAQYSQSTELHIENENTIRDENHTGILSVVQTNKLIQNKYKGSGTLKLINELEDSRTVFNLTSDNIYRNESWQQGEKISESFEFIGSGRYKFTSTQGAEFDIDLDEFVLKEQDGEMIDYRFSGSGTYSFPPTEGTIDLDYDLLGIDIHTNWEGKAFTCEKYRISTLIEYTINITKFSFSNDTFIWVVVDNTNYEDRTIYVEWIYRYSENDLVMDQHIGRHYPPNAPSPALSRSDILTAIDVTGVVPVKILAGDSMSLTSSTSLTVLYTADTESTEVIDGDTYSTTVINGMVTANGQGTTTMEVVNTGRFSGWVVSRSEEFALNNDRFKRDIKLIS